ncbi:GNAT family N-acetyltransferase [Bacillus sp. AK128]
MIIKQDTLTIRPLKNEDAKLLAGWLSDERVLQYYEGRDRVFNLQLVKEKFFHKENEMIYRNIILFEDTPIGYIQYYPLPVQEKMDFDYHGEATVFGMDQFIGEVDYWNKGIGTNLVTMMVQYLTNEMRADKIVMDPQTWNERAIRCYEKCGFIKKKLLPKHEWHEGEYRDCWLIEYTS